MTKILGQDVSTIKNQLVAIVLNLYSWALSFLVKRKNNSLLNFEGKDVCVSIAGPGVDYCTCTLFSIPINVSSHEYHIFAGT